MVHHARKDLRVLRGPLLQRRVLGHLRQLQVLLAEEPEPRALRLVLAARVAAAHVKLAPAQFGTGTGTWRTTWSAAWSGGRYRSSHAIGNDFSEATGEQVERMGGRSGHETNYSRQRTVPKA